MTYKQDLIHFFLEELTENTVFTYPNSRTEEIEQSLQTIGVDSIMYMLTLLKTQKQNIIAAENKDHSRRAHS